MTASITSGPTTVPTLAISPNNPNFLLLLSDSCSSSDLCSSSDCCLDTSSSEDWVADTAVWRLNTLSKSSLRSFKKSLISPFFNISFTLPVKVVGSSLTLVSDGSSSCPSICLLLAL